MTAFTPTSSIDASGHVFDFANPETAHYSIETIAHHLSRENRWANNIEPVSFTVAQHSLLVAAACRLPASRPYALIHDAPEAWTRNLTTPFKLWLAGQGADIVALERRIFTAILKAFGLPGPTAEIYADVHQADQIAVATEWRDIVRGRDAASWEPRARPIGIRIKFMTQPDIEATYRAALESALGPFMGRA